MNVKYNTQVRLLLEGVPGGAAAGGGAGGGLAWRS